MTLRYALGDAERGAERRIEEAEVAVALAARWGCGMRTLDVHRHFASIRPPKG